MIDINGLSKRDLIDLNKRIVERINFLTRQDTSLKIANFNLYDLVTVGNGPHQKYAFIVKINQKTIGIVCDNSEKWNVSPEMLAKVKKPPHEIRAIFSKKFPLFQSMIF